MNYTFQQLKYLVAVADHGSVSAAAKALFVTQPGVSAAILQLEQVCGIQCFVRHRAKGVSITQAGLAFIAEAREVVRRAEGLQHHASFLSQATAETLSVGCLSTTGSIFMPQILERFEGMNPNITSSIFEGDAGALSERLQSGATQVALMYDYQVNRGLDRTILAEFSQHALLPVSHPMAAMETVSLHDLAELPLIIFSEASYEEHVHSMFALYGLHPRIGQRVNSLELMRGLVAVGAGYAILSESSDNSKKLTTCCISEKLPPCQIVLAYSPKIASTRPVSQFILAARETLQQQNGSTLRWKAKAIGTALPSPSPHSEICTRIAETA